MPKLYNYFQDPKGNSDFPVCQFDRLNFQRQKNEYK